MNARRGNRLLLSSASKRTTLSSKFLFLRNLPSVLFPTFCQKSLLRGHFVPKPQAVCTNGLLGSFDLASLENLAELIKPVWYPSRSLRAD